jgi:hypothetical protein
MVGLPAGGFTERKPLLRRSGGTKLIRDMAAEGHPENEILTAAIDQPCRSLGVFSGSPHGSPHGSPLPVRSPP